MTRAIFTPGSRSYKDIISCSVGQDNLNELKDFKEKTLDFAKYIKKDF